MPRQIFDIKGFNYGIISSLDEEDIPQEAASNSLNVDGDVGEGILQGIPLDVEKTIDTNNDGSAVDALVTVKMGEFIEDEGIYYFVYFDATDNKLKVIKNFYGAVPIREELVSYTSTLASPVTITFGSQLTFTKENKSLRIGTGNNEALWVGFTKHKQLGITDYTSVYLASGAPGLDDMTSNITAYNKIKTTFFDVVIASTGATDRFTWTKEGSGGAANVLMTGAAQTLQDGITITFAATTGHTAGDAWRIFVDGVTVEKAELDTYVGTSSNQFILAQTEHAGTGYFQNGTLYSWKYSLVYDGIEESPLGSDTIAVSDTSGGSDYYTIVFKADNALTLALGFFNRRITGVNIYRADSADGTKAGLGYYRLIQSFDINDASGWSTSSSDRVLTIYDYGTYYSYSAGGATLPNAVATYEENSGMPETITDTTPRYSLSRTGGGYHFIGKCYHASIIDATRYIFRSKQLRYDMFDWSSDYLVMPEPITALEYFLGRLYAFSLNKVYRINPELMYIEDVYNDTGCLNHRAVTVNEMGMFFGNATNAWMYNGQVFTRITDAIRQSASGGFSWASFYFHTLTELIVATDSKKGYVLFINERSDTTDKTFIWAYHPEKQRWDAWGLGGYASYASLGVFQGIYGEVFLSNATKTYQLLRNATQRQAWEWYSQELSFGSSRQVKSIVMIKVDATGTVAITYGVDGGTVNVSATSDALLNIYNKTIRLKLSAEAATSTNYVDSLEILYRPLIGNR